MSEKPTTLVDSKLTAVEFPERSKDVVCETKKSPPKRKKEQVQSEIPMEKAEEEVAEEMTKVHEVQKTEPQKNDQDVKSQISAQIFEVIKACEMPRAASTKNVEDDVKDDTTSKNHAEIPEENSVKNKKPVANKTKKIPVVEKIHTTWNAAVPRTWAPISAPSLKERPLVLATHLVPSMPIGLFEVLVEIVEVVTKKPVVLLHESRISRPVAKDVADMAILPASEDWENGVLLPASFVFKHHLNKSKSPCVYADVIVAADRAPHVEDIMDLRGHRCAVPDRRNQISAAGLLFNHLRTKGENPAFFGNTLGRC